MNLSCVEKVDFFDAGFCYKKTSLLIEFQSWWENKINERLENKRQTFNHRMGKPSRNSLVAVCAVTLIYLMCGSQAAPLVCERLVHPLDQLVPHHFEGSWALVAGSLNHSPSMEALRRRDSITMYFSNSSEASTLSYTQINRFGDQCQYLWYNISAEGSTFTFDVQSRFSLSMYFLHTSCPDCVVMRWLVKSSRRISTDLYLLSRRREVEQKELEEFRAQLKCYQLHEPVVMDPTKELCPEQPENQPTAAAAPQAEETVAQKA